MEFNHTESPGPASSSVEPTMGNGMASVEHGGTHDRSSLRTDTAAKSSHSIESSRAKLEHARPRIILLAACLVYLMTLLATFQIGVASIANTVSPYHERVNDQLRAHSSALHEEQIIRSRLGTVLATQLSRGYMETHQDCLIRGLNKADYELLGLGFRYPDVRDWVVEWTMDNCGRLHFAPQVIIEESAPQETVLTYWATISYRARQLAAEAFGFVKQEFGRIWARLHSSPLPHNASLHIENHGADANMSASEQILPERPLPQVPYGFALECDPGQPCRLFYPAELAARFDQPNVSPEFLVQLERHTAAMLTLDIRLARVQDMIIKTSVLVSYLEIPLLVCSLVVFANSITLKTMPARVVPGKEDVYLAKSVLMEHATFLAILSLKRSPDLFTSIRCAVIFGFLTALLGLNMLLQFFIRSSQLETVYNARGAMRDLYLIAWNHHVPGEEDSTVAPRAGDDENVVVVASPTPRPPSRPHHHRLVYSQTSLEQDVQSCLALLGKAPQQQGAVASGTDVVTDFDTDSDGETFVDIAAGMLAEVGDAPCAWSLVD